MVRTIVGLGSFLVSILTLNEENQGWEPIHPKYKANWSWHSTKKIKDENPSIQIYKANWSWHSTKKIKVENPSIQNTRQIDPDTQRRKSRMRTHPSKIQGKLILTLNEENQGWESIHPKYKANENTNRHNPKKKQKQTINKNQVKTLCKRGLMTTKWQSTITKKT